jgi:hypothetical protein
MSIVKNGEMKIIKSTDDEFSDIIIEFFLSIRIRSNNFMKDRRMKSFIKVVGLDNIA